MIRLHLTDLKIEYEAKKFEIETIIKSMNTKNVKSTILFLTKQLSYVMNQWLSCINLIARFNEVLLFYGLTDEIAQIIQDKTI